MKIKPETKIFICPTDTIYGISARFDDLESIEKIKVLKQRPNDFKFITLIADFEDLQKIGVKISEKERRFLEKIWPGPYTVIFKNGISARMPDFDDLRNLIRDIGPIISTSVNVYKERPAKNIVEAKKYFGDSVDEYIDIGELSGESSMILQLIR